eukprot:TRINITY_DN22934_c0_g1_i1.p1 TRINITY_DN22934_c0_g1~~TRINITY_DN22934_c0_g1_i1.p1  ORF type:complete len:326 (+),score=57.56 TRINITY_DN22934_c0_g1_i1:54-1031(+)
MMEVRQLLASSRLAEGPTERSTSSRPKSATQHGQAGSSMPVSAPKSAPQRSREATGSRVPTPELDPRGYAPPFFKAERGKWKLHSDLTYKVSYWQGAVTTTYGLSYVDPQEFAATSKSNFPSGSTAANGSKSDALKQFAELKRALQEKRGAAKNEISQKQTEEQAGDKASADIELAVEGSVTPGTPVIVDCTGNDFRCPSPHQRPKSAVPRPNTASTSSTSVPGRPRSARTYRPQSAASSAQSDWTCQSSFAFGGQHFQPTTHHRGDEKTLAGSWQQRQKPSGFAPRSSRCSDQQAEYQMSNCQQNGREALLKEDARRFNYSWHR